MEKSQWGGRGPEPGPSRLQGRGPGPGAGPPAVPAGAHPEPPPPEILSLPGAASKGAGGHACQLCPELRESSKLLRAVADSPVHSPALETTQRLRDRETKRDAVPEGEGKEGGGVSKGAREAKCQSVEK